MKKLLVAFDDDTAKVLSKKINQSAYVREAVAVYNDSISTDTVAGMRTVFDRLRNDMRDMAERYDAMYGMVEHMAQTIEEMAHR